jgi:hypothetical protein
VLALSVGLALSAICSGQWLDKLFGIAVALVGGVMVAYIALECMRILAR